MWGYSGLLYELSGSLTYLLSPPDPPSSGSRIDVWDSGPGFRASGLGIGIRGLVWYALNLSVHG